MPFTQSCLLYSYKDYNGGMKLPLIIEQDEDGWFVVDCPAIPGCATQGKTKAEALANIREAIDLSLEFRRSKGMPLVLETSEIEVKLIA